jgi:hypothetical protein
MRPPAERFSIGWPWVEGQVVDTIDYSAREDLFGGLGEPGRRAYLRESDAARGRAFRSGSGFKLLLKGIPTNPLRILENFLAFFGIKPVGQNFLDAPECLVLHG